MVDDGAPQPNPTVPDSDLDAANVNSTLIQTSSGGDLTQEQDGRYEMKREFGRGGMSVVFLSFDRHVGREVAFKQLLPHVLDQFEKAGGQEQVESVLNRFLREARITGQLEHPSIIPVYEVGQRGDGSLYYTQKLIRGRTLTKALREAKDLPGRLRLLSHFVDSCQAIGYAHLRGVVHRDIKPDNIMVGEFGETVVLDWGIARVVQEPDHAQRELNVDTNDETQEGDVLGTPQYMSPEQAQGKVAEVDEQSDVWSLGAVLYEILTGIPPFSGKNPIQIIMKVQKDPIVPVRSLCPEAPPELAAVAERALQRDKKQRYGKARQLAREIEAFQSGERVAAFEYSSWTLLKRFVKKNKTVSIVTGVALLLVLGALAQTVLENRKARQNLAQALLEKSDAAGRELNWPLAMAYAAAARPEADSAEARWRSVQRGARDIEPVWRVQLPSSVDTVAIAPEGKQIAAALGDNVIRILDAANGKEEAKCEGHLGSIRSLAFSPDGQHLASTSTDRSIRIWSVSSGCDLVKGTGAIGFASHAAWRPDGSALATAEVGAVRLWDVPSLRQAAKLDGHEGQVNSVSFSPDGQALISGGQDGTLRRWSPLPPRISMVGRVDSLVLRGKGHQPVARAGYAPNGHTVVSGSHDETIRFFDADRPETQHKRQNVRQGRILSLALSTADAFASIGQDSSVVFFDYELMAPVAKLPGGDSTNAAAFTADGRTFVSGNNDGRLRLWRVNPGTHVRSIETGRVPPGGRDASGRSVRAPPATAVASAPGVSHKLAVADVTGSIQLWDLATQAKLWEARGPRPPVSALAYSPDARLIAAAGADAEVHVFTASSGDRAFTLDGHPGGVFALGFSGDGRLLASGGADAAVRLWDVAGKRMTTGLQAANMGPVLAVAFAPDGKRVAAASEDGAVRLWDPKSGKLAKRIDAAAEALHALAFSPHGTLLVTAGKDNVIRVFRAASGALRSVWSGHGGRVLTLSFAPDGETVASASIDGTIRLWDVRTGRQMGRLERHEARGAVFSRDGQWLASIGERPALQLFELDDKKTLLSPAKELARKLKKYKLRFDGINLTDDVEALAPPAGGKRR